MGVLLPGSIPLGSALNVDILAVCAGGATAATFTRRWRRVGVAKKRAFDKKLQSWIDARKRHHLSHAHVKMARELGMNPDKLGKVDNHEQEPLKVPLPDFIEFLYERRFGRTRPEIVASIEELARLRRMKDEERRRVQAERRHSRSDAECLRAADRDAGEGKAEQ